MRVDFLRAVSCLALAIGCAGPGSNTDASLSPPGDVPGQTPGNPHLGAHGLSFYEQGDSRRTISTPSMFTQSQGSTIVVSVGRGVVAAHELPTDNKSNSPYQQVDSAHVYTGTYENSGTALYAASSAKGGEGFQVSTSNAEGDEVTLAAVEVVEGTKVQDYSWKMAMPADTVTSNSVTTTAPATLVAFWWGDANQYFDKEAVPGDGFTPIDHVLRMGSLVQCAVAVKNVTEPGTYSVSWTAKPEQGAQLWLVAVQ